MLPTHLVFWLFALLPVTVLFSGMAMVPVLLFISLMLVLHARPRALPPTQLLLLLAGMLAVPVLSAGWSITPARSFSTIGLAVILCVIGAVALMNIRALGAFPERLRRYYRLSLITVGVLLVTEYLTQGAVIELIFSLTHMDYGRFMTKNINRGLCALAVLVWPYVLACDRVGERREAWPVVLLVGLGIMLFHSLSAKLGLIAGGATYVALTRYPISSSRLIAISIPLFLLTAPALFLLLEKSFFTLPMVQDHLTGSGHQRLDIWHVLMTHVSERPWLGWGADTTRSMPLSEAEQSFLHLTLPPLHPHNPSMQLLLETGIIGLLISVTGIALLLRQWMLTNFTSVERTTSGALIVAYVGAGLSSFSLWQHWWIATLWLALVLWRWAAEIPEASQVSA